MTESAAQTEEMAQLEIRKGEEATVEAGGLRFVACRREVGGIDGGISLNVWGQSEGADRELLRFDFFRKRPHYHSPAENQAENVIDTERYGDGSGWGIEELSQRAPELLEVAGYDAIAQSLDRAALAAAAPALQTLFDNLGEPTEISYFDVPASVLAKLSEGLA